MRLPLKYIVDDSGERTSVLVPIKVWEDLNNNFQKLQAKFDVFKSIEQGFKEVNSAKRTGRKLQTLKEFLK
jgi:hypothetical protein